MQINAYSLNKTTFLIGVFSYGLNFNIEGLEILSRDIDFMLWVMG